MRSAFGRRFFRAAERALCDFAAARIRRFLRGRDRETQLALSERRPLTPSTAPPGTGAALGMMLSDELSAGAPVAARVCDLALLGVNISCASTMPMIDTPSQA